MKNIFLSLILLLSAGLFSCSDSDDKKIYDLTFEKNDYAVMAINEYSNYIMIKGGNGDYTLTPGDKQMIQVSYSPPVYSGFGDIIIKGLKKGTTTLAVKDNVTGQEVKLNITVTDAYMIFSNERIGMWIDIDSDADSIAILNDVKKNALLKESYLFSLIKNEEKTLYIFKSEEDLYKGKFLYKGTYDLSQKTDADYLQLSYKENDTALSYTGKMTSGDGIKNYIFSFLGITWSGPKSSDPNPTVYLVLENDYMDIYTPTYPNLTSAKASSFARIVFPYRMELPVELVK